MSKKILSGSIIKNPTDLQRGAVTDHIEDRSAYLRSDNTVTWTGTQIEFTANIILEIINTYDGTLTQHVVQVANSPIVLANNESAYVAIDRSAALENLTVVLSGTTPIPAQTQANKDIFVLFRRVDAGGSGFLHIPLHKQVLSQDQTVRLGASGSGSGGTSASIAVKAVFTTSLADVGGTGNNAYTPTATTLTKSSNGAFPSAVALTSASNGTDGVTLVLNDYVLLQNEANPANNGVWEITTLGDGLTPWVLTRIPELNTALDFQEGISILVKQGDFFADTTWIFEGSVVTLGTDAITFEKYDGYNRRVYPSAGSTSVGAAGTIPISQYHKEQVFKIVSTGGQVTTATAPFGTTGAAPLDGTIITLIGVNDTNTVTIPYADTSRGCLLNGDCELGQQHTLTLMYNAQTDRYSEIGRTT